MTVLIGAILALVGAIELWNHLLTPGGKDKVKAFLTSFWVGSVEIAQPILAAVGGELEPIASAFVDAFKTFGPAIGIRVREPIAAVARDAFNLSAAGLATQGESTPANALDTAANAFADAFGFGISSAVVTAAFEAAFPEKLNTLNGIGPMLANMAGFEEVAKAVLEPLYKNAFGQSLDYHFRSIFKPELPDEGDAVTWHSRRLLSEAQLRTVFRFSGLKAEYEEPYVQSAFRAVQPRAVAAAFVDVPFPRAEVSSMLDFAGIRDRDKLVLLDAFEANSTKNVRQQYLGAIQSAAEHGSLSDAEVESALSDLNFSDDAKHWVKLTIATKKLQLQEELYRKSISLAYEFGNLSDADYVPALEAIGISEADARAHFALDSIKRHGKDAAAVARNLAAVAKEVDKAAWAAARANFHGGIVDELALAAEFAAFNMPAAAIPFAVALEIQRRKARKRIVFGKVVVPSEAVDLHERVAALKTQRIKKVVDDSAALAQLDAWGIPDQNAHDLVAEWAARADKTKLPIP